MGQVNNGKPPTQPQLDRIAELIEHPKIKGDYLGSLLPTMDKWLRSSRSAGVLIGILKKKVAE